MQFMILRIMDDTQIFMALSYQTPQNYRHGIQCNGGNSALLCQQFCGACATRVVYKSKKGSSNIDFSFVRLKCIIIAENEYHFFVVVRRQ
jgi:hypothetical protein